MNVRSELAGLAAGSGTRRRSVALPRGYETLTGLDGKYHVAVEHADFKSLVEGCDPVGGCAEVSGISRIVVVDAEIAVAGGGKQAVRVISPAIAQIIAGQQVGMQFDAARCRRIAPDRNQPAGLVLDDVAELVGNDGQQRDAGLVVLHQLAKPGLADRDGAVQAGSRR